ncbi:NUDIX hydrolase [Micromonospora sp. NPDC006766]|uniref:NUDIX hydrolase n=1 Tax=Micromonospora sp. NPDC006766 TaxID=3154778 RepID=UPI0033E2D132
MSYIAQLRALVGTRPLILPGTSVLVLDDIGRVLLIERTGIAGWGLPGGFMEPGESFEDAGRREVLEETGLEIGALTLLGVFSGPEYYFRYPNGDEVHNVTAAYTAPVRSGTLAVDGTELRGGRFFAVDELPDDIIGPEKPIVDAYAQRLTPARPR